MNRYKVKYTVADNKALFLIWINKISIEIENTGES